MAKDFEVIGYQKHYKRLNTKLAKNEPQLFTIGVLIAYESELHKGFGVVKQLKTYSNGTKFNYEPIKTKEQAEEYKQTVEDILATLDKDLTVTELLNRFKELASDEEDRNDRELQSS